MKIYTKPELIEALRQIKALGWIKAVRAGKNDGVVGNTLETLLGITENNLPIPNSAEWELKAQRRNTASLVTLLHMEPSPRALRWVPRVLLPLYGWPAASTYKQYPPNEMSFRQTINALTASDRGFQLSVDYAERKISVSFDAELVDARHEVWLHSVAQRIGLGQLDPQPYWGFDDLLHKAGTKLHNCFFVQADVRREIEDKTTREYFHFNSLKIMRGLSLDGLITAVESGAVYVDFDARTGHNHGTKFRIRADKLELLYAEVETVF